MTTQTKQIATKLLLLALLVIALLKRVLFLGDKCFWWDEFLTEQRVWYTDQEIFENPMTARAVIYSFMLKAYANIVSFFTHNNYLTEFQLRLPHAIAGTLAIIIIYKIGKQLKDRTTGLFLAFLATFSPFLIIYAREARYYPFVLLFSACLIHAVILIVKRQDNKKALLYYAYYSATAILGMHTHQGFWLLFAASNVFLGLFEIKNFIFSKDKKASLIFLIQIIWLLTLPIITAYFCIDALLTKGANSDIIKAAKLVPSLDLNFFKTTNQELWEGIRLNHVIHFLALAAAIILLIPKKTRALSIYLLTVTTITFIALRNMGTFKEPFRVKYITFIWLVEAIALTLALTTILDFLLAKLKKQNLANAIKYTTLTIIAILSLASPIQALKLPQSVETKYSYRSLAKTLNSQIQPNDIVVSYEEGFEALNYYKRVYNSDWHIIGAHQLESPYDGNYVYDGYAFALFQESTAIAGNDKYLTKIADAGGYSLYKSNEKLDSTLQNNLLIVLNQGFQAPNYLPNRNQADKLYYTSNYLKNGNFENELTDWKPSEINKDYMSISVLTTNNTTYLNVTNNYNVALVLSQTIDIPDKGVYALVFKTHGFYNGGHFTITSDDVNQDIYRAEITNPIFPRFHNFTFTKPQKAKFHITIKPDGYAALYNFAFYKLEER